MNERIICWFSCGAASAVATKLAIADNAGKLPLVIAYTEVIEEHPDNKRFIKDCEKWFDQEVLVLGNDRYERSIYKTFETSAMNIRGASPCTQKLKNRFVSSLKSQQIYMSLVTHQKKKTATTDSWTLTT